VGTVTNALLRLKIDTLEIQEEEVLTFLSGSENRSISNIKLAALIHIDLIFKEKAKINELGLREKGLAQPYYSIQHIEAYHTFVIKTTN
jgi:hypothetical protein